MSSDLPVDVHVTGDFSVFENLTRALRRWRWRHWRRGWRTGATSQQHSKKSQRQHAFPKMVHRTTRDEWKSNFRDPTDHGRPDHSFFIADGPACASKAPYWRLMAVDFALGIERVYRFKCVGPDRAPSPAGLAKIGLGESSSICVGWRPPSPAGPAPQCEARGAAAPLNNERKLEYRF